MKRLLLFSGWLSLFLAAPAHAVLESDAFARLAVQDKGRKKPYTTFARESLQMLAGKAEYPTPGEGKMSAVEAVTSLWLRPSDWEKRPVILINYLPLKEALGFPKEQKLFTYNQIVDQEAFRNLYAETQKLRKESANPTLNRMQKEVEQVAKRLGAFEGLVTGRAFAVVPHPSQPNGAWVTVDQAASYYPGGRAEKLQGIFADYREAFLAGKSGEAGKSVSALAAEAALLSPAVYPPARLLELEHFYQGIHPFRLAWIAYLSAAIALLATTAWKTAAGYRIGWVLVLAGFFLQVSGFVCRIVISGRAPVTNMYETVIWLAFGTVLFAIILEAIYRGRYFLLAAAPIAVVSLILADNTPTVLDSAIHPLVPVLRNNFWLSTHVTSITLSYAAFALALGLGHIVLGKIAFGKSGQNLAVLHQYVYRALQIGVLLLAMGTILGGVWANYSWGRFWDWDPKETWALIALLSYLVLLHGRVAGRWGGFGLAVGSVLCFQTVLMAWYGVNFVLGQGLHSYGFGSGGFRYVLMYVAAELVFVGVAVWKAKWAPGLKERPASEAEIAAG
jgi:ABC-type transport system involved in cytochrome c biogenesis permease subunit